MYVCVLMFSYIFQIAIFLVPLSKPGCFVTLPILPYQVGNSYQSIYFMYRHLGDVSGAKLCPIKLCVTVSK